MSNFNYRSQFQYSFAGQHVSLYAQIGIGASGAPTIAAKTGMGIKSIVRNSAGNYTITLTQAFAALLDVNTNFISGASAPAAGSVNIVSQAVTSSTTPTIVIQCRNSAGTATDPASGEIMLFSVDLDRSSLGH